ERDLEAVRHELRTRLSLPPHELLEIVREALFQLAPLELREVEPDVRLQRLGEALAQKLERPGQDLGPHPLHAGPLPQPPAEGEPPLARDVAAAARANRGAASPRRDD